MEDLIIISNLNDFIFCPASIYFHKLYGSQDNLLYQSSAQINGTKAHETIDEKTYSTRKSAMMSLDVYSEKYGLCGKIDLYESDKKRLIERKKHVRQIYDGYIFQLYAQYAFCASQWPLVRLPVATWRYEWPEVNRPLCVRS